MASEDYPTFPDHHTQSMTYAKVLLAAFNRYQKKSLLMHFTTAKKKNGTKMNLVSVVF